MPSLQESSSNSFHSLDDFHNLLKELESIKRNQKSLAQKEAQCREDLMELMKDNGIEKEDSDYGSIRLVRRVEKDYGSSIRTMEIELKEMEARLKEEKKLADDMGDYTTINTKEILVYNPPKETFF